MGVKAMYTLTELSRLAGLSARQVRGLLEANGILLRSAGRGRKRKHFVVLLADLKAGLPEFWESCLDAEALRSKT